MTDKTSFEVQYQRNGQWIIHEDYKGHQRDAAITEAKTLWSEVEAVRVVKEVFDPDTGVFNDVVIFKENNEKRIAAAQKVAVGGRYGGFARYARRSTGRNKSGNNQTSFRGSVAVKLLFALLFSIGLSAGLAIGASELLGGRTLFGVRFVGIAETNLLIFVFMGTFAVSASFLSFKLLRGESLRSSSRPVRSLLALAAHRLATKRAAAEAARKGLARKNDAPIPTSPDPGAEEMTEEEKQAKAAEDEATTERLRAALDEDKADAEAKPEDNKEDKKKPGALSPEAENLKAYMITFLTRSLEEGQADMEKMDSFNKFGVSLFMAGASEILSEKGNMDLRSRSIILAESVEIMGFKKSHAGSFAGRYEEYLMADPRYMQMFQAGRNAINIYLDDESAGPRLLDDALAEWNKPKPTKEQTGPVTVMFTGVDGLTAMTQTLGDTGAKRVVRVHNRIVREAVGGHAGKEIKHTGDGIMASFNKTADAVDAAIQMQRDAMAYTQRDPDFPLPLKIGISAGEPIAENNDLFGAVVQLSARIVDAASADQIFVSDVVHGLCAGKDYNFFQRDGFSLKGFDEEMTLYEALWNETGTEGGDEESPPSEPDAEAPSEPDAGGAAKQPATPRPNQADQDPAFGVQSKGRQAEIS